MDSITRADSITRVESITKSAIYTQRIEFITVLIEEIERDEAYEIYTATEKQGKQFINSTCSLTEAYLIVEEEEQRITERIAKKRKGKPTMRQLALLFDLKIPIPVTLKFGEASDLIDTALTEKRNARREKIRVLK